MHNMNNTWDLIVVGSGVAGLTTALTAADAGARVALVSAGNLLSGSSALAQGGIAAAISADDTPLLHESDTIAVGGGMNDPVAVRVLVGAGNRAIGDLLDKGVPFEGGRDHLDLGLEAGHQRHRIVHAGGGATGQAVSRVLVARALAHDHIHVVPQTPVDRLLLDGNRVCGVQSGSRQLWARAVIIATGGYASLWRRTTNTPESTGSGLILAWSAGAMLADLEFVQFHPTALSLPHYPAFLLSEALRGAGALLVDQKENPVIDPLQPRDVVARAIAAYERANGQVYLSLRHLPSSLVLSHFSAIAEQLRQWDIDLARDLLPVSPAAHYCMGGVRSDLDGRTSVPGLYVAGEVACTGAQGANRLASNSLLECLVFGKRAALAALSDGDDQHATWPTSDLPGSIVDWHSFAQITDSAGKPLPRKWEQSNADLFFWGKDQPASLISLDESVGVERHRAGLTALLGSMQESNNAPWPDRLLFTLIATSALIRAESRGAHYRRDYPNLDDSWRGRILWQKEARPQFERIIEP